MKESCSNVLWVCRGRMELPLVPLLNINKSPTEYNKLTNILWEILTQFRPDQNFIISLYNQSRGLISQIDVTFSCLW